MGWAQLRGAQAAISREGSGEQGTHSKGQEEGGSITHPHRPLPWPWGYQAEPGYQSQLFLTPSKLHTYFGVLEGPLKGWGAIARKGDWTVKSHVYGTLLEMGRNGPLQVALCLAQSLQAAWDKEGASCRA